MKKILFLIALTLSLTSCVDKSTDNVPETMYIEYSDGIHRAMTPVYFTYNGHKYITFIGSQNYSTVHDPDCECHENNTHESYFEY